MSASQTRPARVRGPQQRPSHVPASPAPAEAAVPLTTSATTDSDETRALRRKYGDKLATLKELFPNWTEEDILSVLSDVNGSLEVAVGRISEGNIASQHNYASYLRHRIGI
jgi:CUE domain